MKIERHEAIRLTRRRARMTIADVSERLDIHPELLRRIERGQASTTTTKLLLFAVNCITSSPKQTEHVTQLEHAA